MQVEKRHYAVVIVGAGPSGLMMAAQLIRFGIQPLIMDCKTGPTNQSRALAVQARSMEIYRQMGVVDQVLEGGKQAKSVTLYENDDELAHLLLENMGKDESAFPFIEIFEQSKNEKLLLDYLTSNCCPVYWETTLLQIEQQADNFNFQITSSGETISLSADWLIGADGGHSEVRQSLQIAFNGDTYRHHFYLADLKLQNEFDQNGIKLFLGKNRFTACFPMKNTNTYRFIGSLPQSLLKQENLNFSAIEPYLVSALNRSISITECNWFATYQLHHRMAESFRKQQCFLIGDAAHVHSPVGGQGMNTGLQDAYNLAWKLAGVVNKHIRPAILESYAAERMPVASQLLKTTDRLFTIIVSGSLFIKTIRHFLFPKLIRLMWRQEGIRRSFFSKISQTAIHYRHSKLSLHLSRSGKVKAGDRLPYLKIWDEKKLEMSDLHQWCMRPGFVFIIFGIMAERDLFTLAQWIKRNYSGILHLFYLPPSEKNQHVFGYFEIGKNMLKAILVRPDMHIGMMSDQVDIGILDNYMESIAGCIRSEK
ncbi:MAG: FAD-dependent monooxygenase [Sphingobacteriaceae bacterium]